MGIEEEREKGELTVAEAKAMTALPGKQLLGISIRMHDHGMGYLG